MVTIYKITNLHDNSYYIGQTKNLNKRIYTHKTGKFKSIIEQFGEDILQIDILTTSENNADKEELKYSVLEYMKNKNILNKSFGHYYKITIDKVLKDFGIIDESNFEEFYDSLIHYNEKPNTRTVDKNKKVIVYTLSDVHNQILVCKSMDLNIKQHYMKTKVVNNFNDNALIKFQYIGIYDYEEAFEKCMKLCIRLFVNDKLLLNKMFGKINRKMFEVMKLCMKRFNYKNCLDEIKCNGKTYRIYKITNLINNKIYIGRTKTFLFQRLLKHYKHNTVLSKDMQKYGINNFKIECIYKCKNLNEAREQEYNITQSYLNKGYDLYNIRIGDKMSENEIKQMKNNKRGNFHHAWNKGQSWSSDMKKKLSEARKGQKPTSYCLQRSLEIHLGSKQSKETIEKRRKNLFKKVLCVTTKEIFDSKYEAANKYNIKHYKIVEYSYKHQTYSNKYWKVLTTEEKKKLIDNNYNQAYIDELCKNYLEQVF